MLTRRNALNNIHILLLFSCYLFDIVCFKECFFQNSLHFYFGEATESINLYDAYIEYGRYILSSHIFYIIVELTLHRWSRMTVSHKWASNDYEDANRTYLCVGTTTLYINVVRITQESCTVVPSIKWLI